MTTKTTNRNAKGKFVKAVNDTSLRSVIHVVRYAQHDGDMDTVIYDCGHRAYRKRGEEKGHCGECDKQSR